MAELAVGIVVIVVVIAADFGGLRERIFGRFGSDERTRQREAQRIEQQRLVGDLQQRFPGFDILPHPGDTSQSYVAGRGVGEFPSGKDLVVIIDEIRLEKHES